MKRRMFWDKAALLYDLVETVYNGRCYRQLGIAVASLVEKTDRVLECACGTGAISQRVAPACQELVATDASSAMLKKAAGKCAAFPNVHLEKADIMALCYEDETFDKVIAGNVLHLLPDPYGALSELKRVCRTGGKLILPTYVNMEQAGKTNGLIRGFDKLGAGFQRQFDYAGYQAFFAETGFFDASFQLIEGRLPCAVAILTKS